jgi:hypothetical protein
MFLLPTHLRGLARGAERASSLIGLDYFIEDRSVGVGVGVGVKAAASLDAT